MRNMTSRFRWTLARRRSMQPRSRRFSVWHVPQILLCLFALSGTASAATASAPLMAIPGAEGVSASGAFTYTVALQTPPGTAGMVPNLALAYTSQTGDGYEGQGWTLQGLHEITRCPRTVSIDTVHGSVNFDGYDRFCYDGEPLTAITGTYGADGTVYHLIDDDFTQFISHGTTGSGPSSFTAQYRNGSTAYFGGTGDSQFKPLKADGTGVSSSILIWAENKLVDAQTNYFAVTYTNDTTNSQLFPIEIDYTGHGTSLSPYNSVQFTYMDRTADIVPQYIAGTYIQTTKLLTHIKTYNGSTVITDYQLAYNFASSGASHNELSTLKQCDATGTTCLAPTSFTWQGSRDAPSLNTGVDMNSMSHGFLLEPGDFTGSASSVADGLTDALVADPSCPANGVIWAGSSAGTFARASTSAIYNYYQTNDATMYSYASSACFLDGVPAVADLNGDGFSDVVQNETHWVFSGTWSSSQYSNPMLNNKAGTISQTSTSLALLAPLTFGDFNGDGRTDGLGELSNGDGTFTADTTHSSMLTGSTVYTGDFDGDGCTDILTQGTTNGIGFYCNPAVSTATAPSFSGSTIVIGDYNGDGKADVLAVSSTTATLYFGTGTGLTSAVTFSYSGTPALSSWHNYQIVTGDWNGDGRTDIALVSQTSGTAHAIALSTGTGFIPLTTIANSDTTGHAVVADWNNDGADDLWFQFTSSTHDTDYTFAFTPELVTAVDNGLGSMTTPAATTVVYGRLNQNGTLYTKGTSATYSMADLDGPYVVVKELDHTNAVGGNYVRTYAYAGAITDDTAPPTPAPKSNLVGTGFISFSSVSVTDVATGAVKTTNLNTAAPYVGRPASEYLVQGSVTLSSRTYSYTPVSTGGSAQVIELTRTVFAQSDVTGTAAPTTATNYTYDSYANPITIAQTSSDGSTETITDTYNYDTTNWVLGTLSTRSDQRVVGGSNVTRHYSYGYGTATDGNLGLMETAALEPGTSSLELDATFTYDAYGNRTSTYLDGVGVTGRTAQASGFDSTGRFPTTGTDAVGLVTTSAFNSDFGTISSVTDPDTLTTAVSYDTFGRMTHATKKDGTKIGVSYAYCSGVNGGSTSCPAHGATAVTVTPFKTDGTTSNGAVSICYYDALGREVGEDTQGFDGSVIRQETQYDAYLHVGQTSRPYFLSGGTAYWTVYSYLIASTTTLDPFGRPWSVTAPDSGVTAYSYDALATSQTDPDGNTTVTTLNGQGFVASVKDALLHTTSYLYDGFGDVIQTTDSNGNVAIATYDVRGRKLSLSDPDTHSTSFSYDVLSEMTSRTDAKSQTATFTYDLDQRPKRRADSDLTTLKLFDSGGSGGNYGFGRPYRECNASTCSSATYQRTFTYNSLGQVSAVAIKADGTTYTYSLGYDSTSGRLNTVTYPSGFVAQYDYNAYGYLADIKDQTHSTTVWTANARNAELQLTKVTAGNGIISTNGFDPETGRVLSICASSNTGTCDGNRANFAFDWDKAGNLTERDDTYESVHEKMCYDVLNRLTDSGLGSDCTSVSHKYQTYSRLGNIMRKSDVCTATSCMTYGGGTVGPHALTSITGTVNGIVNPTFTYDADGNMTAGLGRSLTWTSYNMISEVTQGTTTVDWQYGADRLRYKKCLGGCTSPTATTLYLNGPVQSEKVVAGSTTTWNDYIAVEGQLVAIHFKTGSTETMRYLVNDHLGSSSVMTDASGTVVERDSYDAWGRRRNADFSADSQPCSLTSQTTRGFTGQEHDDNLCIENFNARMYDPLIGRFLNADTIIPNPLDGQTLNRYSYARNNPLNAVDPTGHVANVCKVNCQWSDPACITCDSQDTSQAALLGTSAAGFVDESGGGYGHAGDCTGAGCTPGTEGGGDVWGVLLTISNPVDTQATTDQQTIETVYGYITNYHWHFPSTYITQTKDEEVAHVSELAVEAASIRREMLNEKNKFVFRGEEISQDARIGVKADVALNSWKLTLGTAKVLSRSLAAISLGLSVDEAYNEGFSNRSIAKLVGATIITGLAVAGAPELLIAAGVLTAIDLAGGFDPIYDAFDDKRNYVPDGG